MKKSIFLFIAAPMLSVSCLSSRKIQTEETESRKTEENHLQTIKERTFIYTDSSNTNTIRTIRTVMKFSDVSDGDSSSVEILVDNGRVKILGRNNVQSIEIDEQTKEVKTENSSIQDEEFEQENIGNHIIDEVKDKTLSKEPVKDTFRWRYIFLCLLIIAFLIVYLSSRGNILSRIKNKFG